MAGTRLLKVTARHYTCCWHEHTIVSVTRVARPYTILSADCQTHTHSVYIEAGTEGEGGNERGRMEGGREQDEGGSDDVREPGIRSGGRVEGGSEGGTERAKGEGTRTFSREINISTPTLASIQCTKQPTTRPNYGLDMAWTWCIIGNPSEAG